MNNARRKGGAFPHCTAAKPQGELFMIKTRGLTHIHLVVKEIQRSLDFYQKVFGMEVKFWAGDGLVFLNTPGSHDLITLHQSEGDEPTGTSGGILHFGFELKNRAELENAISEVVAAGGALKKRGEFTPGMPFAYVSDPDGYEIEL
jgi:catechol 2,3-dioxygenase-like lactoylglutathione lyase family enzyme